MKRKSVIYVSGICAVLLANFLFFGGSKEETKFTFVDFNNEVKKEQQCVYDFY